MIVRKGSNAKLHSNMSWRDIKCWAGRHLEWRKDIYVNNGIWFLYCPNCHQERVPDFYTPLDIPPPEPNTTEKGVVK